MISTRILSVLVGSAVAVTIVGGGLLSSAPAVAVDVTCADATATTCTLDGVIYQVDPADPDSGATVTGSTAALQSFFTLPDAIIVGEQRYVVTGIGPSAFAGRGMNRLNLPPGLVRIGESAFAGDSKLVSVVIPASVRSIGASAFAGVDLTEIDLLGPAPVVIPAGADGSFDGATLHVPWGQSTEAGLVDGYTPSHWQGYGIELEVMVTYDTGDHGTAPPSETDPQGFSYYTSPAENDGDWWFLGWFTDPALTQPYAEGAPLEGDLTLYAAWGHAYSEAGMTFLANATRPDDGATVMAYDPTVGGTTPVIPPSVTIGNQSFDVRTIGDGVFEGDRLSGVEIPPTVTTIAHNAFNDAGLTAVDLPPSVTTIGDTAFTSNLLQTVDLPAGLTELGYGAFWSNSLRAVTIPEGLTTIPSMAFAQNQLETVVLGDQVKTIGTQAFGENPRLAHVTLLGPAPAVKAAGSGGASFDTSSRALVLDVPWRYTTGSGPSAYTVPRWKGYTTRAIATITVDAAGGDPVPSIQVPVGGSVSALQAPTRRGFSFTGWLVDGQSVELPLAVTGDLTLTAGWQAVVPTVATIELHAAATSVPQGGTVHLEVTARDADGAPVDIDEGDIALTSDIPSDVVHGLSVTFPHASSHVLTATYLPTGATASVTVEVVPSAAPNPGLAMTGVSPSAAVPVGAAGAIALGMLVLGALGLRRRLRDR